MALTGHNSVINNEHYVIEAVATRAKTPATNVNGQKLEDKLNKD